MRASEVFCIPFFLVLLCLMVPTVYFLYALGCLMGFFFHIYMFYSDFTYQKKKNDGNGGMLV